MLNGLNHITLSVRDLTQSIEFYRDILGMNLKAEWATGAYLSCGDLWLCLSLNKALPEIQVGYTHYAFTIDHADFADFCNHLTECNVPVWQKNISEGDSYYFLDPNGHQLEVHVGNLLSRLHACKDNPYPDMKFYD